MREIPLSRGMVAIVDDDDYEMLSAFNWFVKPCGKSSEQTWYAWRHVSVGGKSTTGQLHRMIMLPDPGQEVDHRNGDGLDNRKDNLRICRHRDNLRNQKKMRAGTSPYKGVYWNRARSKWQSQIGGREIPAGKNYLGLFADAVDAALAYDVAAISHFGEFARPNFLRC